MLLAALFEGIGIGAAPKNLTTPAFCCDALVPAFEECCRRQPNAGYEAILQATLRLVHERCLGNPALASHAAARGASATLVLLDPHAGVCTMACVGHTPCLTCHVAGSFNAARPHGRWLTTPHTTDNVAERSRAARRPPAVHVPLPRPAVWQLPGSTGAKGGSGASEREPTVLTRAIGMQSLQGAAAAGGRSASAALEVDVASHTLTPANHHIILGSAAVFDVLSPVSVMLRASLYEKVS